MGELTFSNGTKVISGGKSQDNGPVVSETLVIGGQQANAPAANAGGRVFGCLMPKGSGPVEGDFSSLKEAAEKMLKSRTWAGLNPHRVLRLCREFKELKERDAFSQGLRQRCIESLSWMVADMKHRFDDCRNSFEVTAEGAGEPDPVMATGGYSPELTEAIELLDTLQEGTEVPDEDALRRGFREGFEHAKKIILAEIAKLAG